MCCSFLLDLYAICVLFDFSHDLFALMNNERYCYTTNPQGSQINISPRANFFPCQGIRCCRSPLVRWVQTTNHHQMIAGYRASSGTPGGSRILHRDTFFHRYTKTSQSSSASQLTKTSGPLHGSPKAVPKQHCFFKKQSNECSKNNSTIPSSSDWMIFCCTQKPNMNCMKCPGRHAPSPRTQNQCQKVQVAQKSHAVVWKTDHTHRNSGASRSYQRFGRNGIGINGGGWLCL